MHTIHRVIAVLEADLAAGSALVKAVGSAPVTLDLLDLARATAAAAGGMRIGVTSGMAIRESTGENTGMRVGGATGVVEAGLTTTGVSLEEATIVATEVETATTTALAPRMGRTE